MNIAATFTAEPLAKPLAQWGRHLNLSLSCSFAPYNQVFQTLLDPASLFHQSPDRLNVLLVRPEDWQRFEAAETPEGEKKLAHHTQEFLDALQAFPHRDSLLVIVPASTSQSAPLARSRQQIADLCRQHRISILTSEDLESRYSCNDQFDPVGDREGHLPYHPAYEEVLATAIARHYHARLVRAPKVVVFDADNTLWRGVAAEVGPSRVLVDGPFQALQQRALALKNNGTLLAIASKNETQDVQAVFATNENMLLAESDFVSIKANWEAKSTNIAELADELNLGLDAFLFLDDNPVEIAEVSAALPAVTAIQLPEDPEDYADFLNHLWPLDQRADRTAEDAQRTTLYQAEASRAKTRSSAPDFATFLRELDLKVTFPEVSPENLPRLAQLTQRTNQFNSTTIRRSEDDLIGLIEAGWDLIPLAVSDRFGEYGLTGLASAHRDGTSYLVDSFLMSCRILGKGVEQRFLARLAELAQASGCTQLVFNFEENDRNVPVRNFLSRLSLTSHAGQEGRYTVSLEDAVAASQRPISEPANDTRTSQVTQPASPVPTATYRAIALNSTARKLSTFLTPNPDARPELTSTFAAPKGDVEQSLSALWTRILGISPIGRHDRFSELGGKSLQVIQLLSAIARDFPDAKLTSAELFENPTLASQARLLGASRPESAKETPPEPAKSDSNSSDLAIVGMSCRLPESPNTQAFWQNLLDGKECLTRFTEEELQAAGVDLDAIRNDPTYVPVKGMMKDVELFDAQFFGILPNEAKLMDPQQRIFLELAWECLEDAGYNSETYPGKIGVWAGNYLDTYAIANLATDRKWLADWIPQIQVGSLQAELGNDKDYLATRVAFKLNLRGPAMTVQTACSTSLVAIAQACQSIRAGQCEMALAGAIIITLPNTKGYHYTPDSILSRDGSCKAFSDQATGTVFSNGAGLVLIKKLDDALRDGDHIHAVIKGCALNNDGGNKHSYTAPSIDGQADVITSAIKDAGVDPSTISYVEAHGTGTPLGDPIEIAGLTKAFRSLGVSHQQGCALGSVKTNVGHLDVASGVTATIKTAFALEHGQLPATLHYEKPNPKIRFEDTPFRINAELSEWETREVPRRAGISSFGVGGTNAHLILEEPPRIESSESTRPYQIFPLSARSETALANMRENLVAHFSKKPNPQAKLPTAADVSHTLRIGRKEFARRMILVGSALEHLDKAKVAKGSPAQLDAPLVFMFPGQGSQTVGMGKDLYASEPYFRAELDRCAKLLEPHLGEDIRDTLFPEALSATSGSGGQSPEDAAHRIKQTVMAQPAIFIHSYCVARLLMHWGLKPTALVGHSVGELVAATLSGVISLEDALRILAHRGRLMQAVEPGGMLSVRLSESELTPLIPDRLDLAAVNGPALCVVAGPHEELSAFEAELTARDVACKSLHTSHGFHSWMMDAVIDPFREVIATAQLSPPSIPIRSTVTTEWLTDEQATDANYWASHVRRTVRFTEAAAHFCESPETTLLEVGPGQTLSTLSRQVTQKGGKQAIFSTSGHATSGESDALTLQLALGQLWIHGHSIDWQAYDEGQKRKRVPLPTYPFERKRFWIEPQPLTDPAPATIAQVDSPAPSATSSPPFHSPASSTSQSVPPVSAPTPAPSVTTDRKPTILAKLQDVLNDLSGIEHEDMTLEASLIELGFDSLMLTQVSKEIERAFAVATTMRQLLGELPTIGDIVNHLDNEMPTEALREAPNADPGLQASPASPAPVPVEQPAAPQHPSVAGQFVPGQQTDQHGLLTQMMQMQMQQMQFMQQQMALLAGQSQAAPPLANVSALPVAAAPAPAPQPTPVPPAPSPSPAPVQTPAPAQEPAATPSGTTTSISRDLDLELSPKQRAHLDHLIERYVRKTKSSKDWTARYRKHYADPRTVSGFNRSWKEMIYQIVVERSKGSRLHDLDGNEYIDILNGFGPGFFGHSPDFVMEAMQDQFAKGFEVGPQMPLAGETAELFCQLTGNERASFVCTGSEAVQAAMRLARTHTGRDKIAVFTKDYHGNFDEVLLRGSQAKKKPRTFPSAPGVPKSSVSNMLVLDYGTEESLEILKEHAHELAAIMVEPVQSRRPEFQPREFIQALRQLTHEHGIVFIMDEVICGLRDGPRGAQGFYGVEADISTYGKVIGGGLPIGIVAGKAEYMDTFDGGMWQYGDDSFPEAGVTFFAGTFVRHPLSIAAANAVLKHINRQGPALWENLNRKARRLYTTVDQFMVENEVPVRLPGLNSRFFIRVGEENKYGNLLFFHLREKGVFGLEGFPSYLTTAHTDADIDYIIAAFKESVAEMQEGGFFKPTGALEALGDSRLTGPPSSNKRQASQGDVPRQASIESIPATPQFTPPSRSKDLPLTEAQREIWLACQLGHEASCAFNEATSLVFEGPLEQASLTRALNQAANRHDSLRAKFSLEGETWEVCDAIQVDVPYEDVSDLTEAEQETRIQLVTETQAFTPFDLAKAPLLRAKLVKLAENKHILFITAHHIVADGWSFNVLIEDLSNCYNALVKQQPYSLEPSPSFANYAIARAKEERSDAPNPHLNYWLDQYPDTVPVLNLPTDHEFPAHRTFKGATLHREVDKALLKKLRKAGAKEGATLYATTLTAFTILLNQLSQQEDLVIGIPAAGQSSQGLEEMVGHCVNFLPLRTRIKSSHSFAELVKQVASRVLEAYEHQDCTYGQLIPRLKLQRFPGRMPLVEVGFNLERMDYFKPFEGLDTKFVDSPKSFVNQLLFLNLVESKDGIGIECHFNTDVIDPSTAEAWLEDYLAILHRIAESPDAPLGHPDSTTADQGGEPLPLSAHSQTDYPRHATVQQLFEEIAATYPERVALQIRDWSLSYGRLNQLANQLANLMRKQELPTGRPVAVMLERSFDYLIAILATLKAGGCYVPVDPDEGTDQLGRFLAELNPSLILTRSSFHGKVPGDFANKAIHLDSLPPLPKKAALPNLKPLSGPTNPAYLMFTSGSTGAAKGVQIPHRGIVRLVKNNNYADLGEDQTFLLASSLLFDASTFEIWAPLLNGGRLVLLPPGPPSMAGIAHAIREQGVTTLWLTAGLFQLMIDENAEALRPLQQLLAGGDILSRHHVAKALSLLPNTRLINGYGPTENTTFSCCHTITREDLRSPSIPIGRPIGNTEVYLLDESQNPLPPGVEGELYLGGDGLALGYYKNPPLTSERFLPNPFSTEPESKLYRTGDRARYRPNGVIEFLGRVDDEVKIRGYRVDPREIEDALCQLADVKQARVVARGKDAANKALVAYVASTSPMLDDTKLRDSMVARLASHLVPSQFVILDQLPVTANGKIDDRALPSPDDSAPKSAEAPRLASGENEERMAKLWEKVLGQKNIPANRSFFDLGGHSLQALKLFHLIDKEFGKKMPLSTLFESNTIAQLAARFAPAPRKQQTPPVNLVGINKAGSRKPIFCIHGGDGGTLIYRELAERLPKDRPIYTIEAPALTGHGEIAPSVEETASQYLAAIRSVQSEGPYLLVGYCFGGIAAYEMAQQLQASGEEVELLCLLDTDNPAVAPRYLNLAERAARNWELNQGRSWAARVGKLGTRFGGGLINRVKDRTEKAAAAVAASAKLEVSGKIQSVVISETHKKAMDDYRPQAYSGNLILFTAEDQGDGVIYPPHLGWEGYVRGELKIISIPGEHLTIFDQPHVETLSHKFNEILDELS
ncbi:MAG: amino acid adenylation domain-containing protein [Verrucomicrobiota bacterium JB023]|nr:amino acid adenylation domain-containing protein [Verrucomicrobiota bacterium JB023]